MHGRKGIVGRSGLAGAITREWQGHLLGRRQLGPHRKECSEVVGGLRGSMVVALEEESMVEVKVDDKAS